MGRKINTFSKAIKHLKSSKYDMLEAAPTNNTMGFMSKDVHGFDTELQPDTRTYASPDFTQDDSPDDTSGLFEADGTPKTALPGGDTSYILGPMSAMWYAWANYTQIGYIREADRRMVNLGRITGQLGSWDQETGFTSYGQLTLEQAQWFYNVKKYNNADNDTPNYRAFYPGPPSNTPDEDGRYWCVITGEPKQTGGSGPVNGPQPPTPDGHNPGDHPYPNDKKDDKGDGENNDEIDWKPYLDRAKAIDAWNEDQVNKMNDAANDRASIDAVGTGGMYITLYAVDFLLKAVQLAIQAGATTYAVNELINNWNGIISMDGWFGPEYGPKPAPQYGREWVKDGNGNWVDKESGMSPKEADMWDAINKKLQDKLKETEAEIAAGEGGNGGKTRKPKKRFPGNAGWSDSYKPKGNILSESRKTQILKNLKNPVVIPEEQKKFKVKPKIRGLKTVVSKPVETPKQYKKIGGRNLWGKAEYDYNTRQSQERKNETLELLGASDHHWEYMTETSKKKNAEEMAKFYGDHPDLYTYTFGGKKQKVLRKEQLKGDYLVFLVDENGVKSNMLQSKLNEKLVEEEDKKFLDQYNKTNPKPKQPKEVILKRASTLSKNRVSYENDPLFKKIANRLNKEIDYKDKPAKFGFPDNPPPEMVNDRHPDFGKRPGTSMFNRLDPQTAKAMPKQDDPTIDAKVAQAKENPKRQKFNKEEWEKSDWRKDLIGEGMNTQMLTGILPSAGNADLENIQLGLTGEGDIDYGEPGTGDESMEGEGQYTCFSNLDVISNVDQPNNTGWGLRLFDQDSKEFRNQLHGGGEHGFLLAIPGYQRGMLRNVKPSGDYNAYDKAYRTIKGLPLKQNGTDLYYHMYGQTNDELGKGPGSWNSTDGVTDNGWGTVLNFNGPGSPRYVALKAMDSTQFDTIKLHAAVDSSSMVSTYRDGDGVLLDKRVQVYYWAGDHDDYVKHSSASNIYDGSKYVSGDGWRPINMKPNGELDNTVDPYIIKYAADREMNGIDANGVAYSAAGKLHQYSVPIPEYARGKNARYIIVQVDKNNFSDDSAFALASVRFQRKSILRVPSISKPLTDLEGAAFVRVGQGVDKNAEQRRKSVRDILKSSKKYVNKIVGDPFPGTDAEVGEAQGTSGSEYVPQAWDDKRQEFGDVGTLDQQKDKFVSKDVKLPPTYAEIQKAKKKK